jgi:pantetheine-phosphate adenylyltransferase
MMKKYKIGLLVGRFQPFHKGHLWLINHALQSINTLIIGIGSANIKNHDNNFLTYERRKEMIDEVVRNEKLSNKVIKVVPLDDYFDDELWFRDTRRVTGGKFDVVVGNNEWTNGIFEKRGYPILRVGFYKRFIYEGEKIRKLMKTGGDWQSRVPDYLISNFPKPISKFSHVILGGTFDHLHRGHKKMLDLAFSLGKKVSLGVATEKLYRDKFLRETIEDIKVRKKAVEDYLSAKKWRDRTQFFYIADIYGPSIKDKSIDAILVSRVTYKNAKKINQIREEKRLPALKIVVAPDVTGGDGQLITSERIRAGEIDREGNPYEAVFKNKKLLKLPEYLRSRLRIPLGRAFLGREDELRKTVYKVIKFIKPIKPVMVVAVGDIISRSLINAGFDPDVKIIDFRSRRKEYRYNLNAAARELYINRPGTINIKTALGLEETIKRSLLKKQKSWFVIKGEEDLLALPAILFAPLSSLVLYGQMDLGVVAVLVTEEKKKEALIFLKKFV